MLLRYREQKTIMFPVSCPEIRGSQAYVTPGGGMPR